MKLGRYMVKDERGFAFASYLFLFSILIYSAAWRITRDFDATGFIVLTLTTLPFIFYPKRARINPYMIVFCAITVVYVLLSLLEVFDRSWTRFFDEFTALRQGFYAIGLPLFVIAAEGTVRHFRDKGKEGWMFMLLLIFGGIIGPILFTVFKGTRDVTFFDYVQFNSLYNIEMFFALAIGYFVLASKKVPKWVGLIICILLFIFSTYLQAQLVALLLMVFLLGAPPRLAMYGAIAGIFILIVSLLPFGAAFREIDPNIGVRIFMWNDSIKAFVDTNGIGIGFGTEYITNFYPYSNQLHIQTYLREGHQYIGNHSAFFSVLMRMGLIGLLALIMFLFSFLPTKGRAFRNLKGGITSKGDPFLCWIYTILIISFASNVALASIHYFIGNAFLIGYLMSFRETRPT